MTFIIQQTLLYAVPLMIVALAGVFAERSGIINLALEGIMIFGAFIGVLFVRSMQEFDVFLNAVKAGDWLTLQGLEILAMLVAAVMGALFSLLLSFASVHLKADQTIGPDDGHRRCCLLVHDQEVHLRHPQEPGYRLPGRDLPA